MTEVIGWAAALAFLLSGVPFAYRAWRTKRADVPWSGVGLILGGSLGMLAYEALTDQSVQQLVDFGITSACWALVAMVKMRQGQA